MCMDKLYHLQSQWFFIYLIASKLSKKHLKPHPIPCTIAHHHCRYWASFPPRNNLKYLHSQQMKISPSRMPFALLNLTAIWCQLSGIWLRRISNPNASCCWLGDTRWLLLLLLQIVSINRFSILELQWHLGPFTDSLEYSSLTFIASELLLGVPRPRRAFLDFRRFPPF